MLARRAPTGDVGRAATNLLWLGCERLTQIGVAIFISGVLARYFGPDAFGKWQYANTLLLVLAPLTWVCGAEILVPTIVHDRAHPLGVIVGSAFALRLAVSVATTAAVWIALAYGSFDPLVAAMLAGLAAALLFREPFGVVNAWLQSRTHSKPALLLSMSTAIVKAALVFALAHAAVAPGRFGWLWAAEAAAIAAGLAGYFAAQHGGRLGWRVEMPLLKHFANAGSVFWLGLICMYLFLKLDRLVLEKYVDYADLGRYAAAQQLNENWITLALMLAQTVAPAFVYRIDERHALRRNLWRLFGLTALLMIAGAVALDACGAFLVRHVFGPGYEGTTEIFRWAVWLSLPAGIEAIGNLVVLKYQAKFVLLTKWLAALLVAGGADLLLVPRYGGYGALAGLACGYLTAVAVNAYYLRLKLHPPS